ncbi:MAG: hypothetical protein KC561_02380 [Myxococcales bacterium]|nr:hypothetical protein [Myxococcales bacterium]
MKNQLEAVMVRGTIPSEEALCDVFSATGVLTPYDAKVVTKSGTKLIAEHLTPAVAQLLMDRLAHLGCGADRLPQDVAGYDVFHNYTPAGLHNGRVESLELPRQALGPGEATVVSMALLDDMRTEPGSEVNLHFDGYFRQKLMGGSRGFLARTDPSVREMHTKVLHIDVFALSPSRHFGLRYLITDSPRPELVRFIERASKAVRNEAAEHYLENQDLPHHHDRLTYQREVVALLWSTCPAFFGY